ncbi:MAG: aminomethyl-transferring glycine dehydrogenase subunit GcvPA [Christensenellaceae bacterium]
MTSYVPNTKDEQSAMLAKLGFVDFEDLLKHIPDEVRLKRPLAIGEGLCERDVLAAAQLLADKNIEFDTIFRGAGAYHHYIPSVVKHLCTREEFVTAYTPYQAEISQGILQAIFEFQTMICELCGLEVANASVYDGATAAGEAMLMTRTRNKNRVLVSEAIFPHTLQVVRTYCNSYGIDMEIIPQKDGKTDISALKGLISTDTACVYTGQISYYGLLEDTEEICAIAHENGARFVLGISPIAAAVLKSAGEIGADIAVGEGQPLGMPLSFGGPYLGFMATKKELMRTLPGRIVGQTIDVDAKRAFVLTLQAREQHIKRERASSSICSNQALCALIAGIYMSAMGAQGMREAAQNSYQNAHYLAREIGNIKGFELAYQGVFFHEFVTHCPMSAQKLSDSLARRGILGGLPLADHDILWCATECNTKEEMDELVSILKEEAAKWN